MAEAAKVLIKQVPCAIDLEMAEASEEGLAIQSPIEEAKIIAADSKPVRRSWETTGGEKKSFHGLLGVCISVFRETNFKEKYESILDEVFEEYSIPRGERVYKGADIYRLFHRRPRMADSFIFKVSQRIAQLQNIRINAFCTSINIGMQVAALLESEGKTPTDEDFDKAHTRRIIPIYGVSSGKQLITVSEFLKKIEGVYPAICAWKLSQVTGLKGQHFMLDFLEGEESRAWNQLVSENHVELIPKGDQCSAYISATDIMLRCIDSILEKRHLFLTKENIAEILSVICGQGFPRGQIHVHSIWNPDIEMIKPIVPRRIPSDTFAKHPVIFIFNEKTGEKDQKNERAEIENSPLMADIFSLAYSIDGGITFYDSEISTRIIRDGDYFVSYGPRGKDKFQELKKFKYPIILYEVGKEGEADKRLPA